MELTPENKNYIDSMSYESLLRYWRFAPAGDPWFQGETGDYWSNRMQQLREEGADHVGASKHIGWNDSGFIDISRLPVLPLAIALVAGYAIHFMAAHGIFASLSILAR